MRRMRVAAALVLSGALAVGGCSSGRPSIELDPVRGATGTPAPTSSTPPPVTVTVATTAIETATLTVTTTTTVTVTAPPSPGPTKATSATTPVSPVFNRGSALADYATLVDDVRTLDRMPLSGNAAALQLDLMTEQLDRLGTNGPPPGLDAPSYYGRLASLGLFTRAAATEARAGSPVAQRRYAVIRQETGVLLSLVNSVLATTFTLPAPAPRATTTTP